MASRRRSIEAALDELAAVSGAEAMVTPGRGAKELMDLAPPGIDELFGMLELVRAGRRYPLIVLDTAPTGHTLRLLEMPDVAREWVHALMRVLLKYRGVVGPGSLGAELIDLARSIRSLQALLQDPSRARFIVVTRAAKVPRAETTRLLARLRSERLAVPAVVVNAMTVSPGRCPRCRVAAAAEEREMGHLARIVRRLAPIRQASPAHPSNLVIIQTALVAPPPRGLAALERWTRTWTVRTKWPVPPEPTSIA
jgi:arsenite-transporting ATPase